MNPSIVHKQRRPSPWRGRSFFSCLIRIRLLDVVQITALAAVLSPALLLKETAALFKICYGTFDCAAGQLQLSGNGTNRRVAFAILVGTVMQVHIDGSRPVRQL